MAVDFSSLVCWNVFAILSLVACTLCFPICIVPDLLLVFGGPYWYLGRNLVNTLYLHVSYLQLATCGI